MTEHTQTLLKPMQKDFLNSIQDILNDSSLEDSTGILKLKEYYASYKKGETNPMSSILQDIVTELMNHVPSEFLTMSIDEIEIKLTGQKKSGSFKVHVEKSIIAFISFKVKVDRIPSPASKLRIEIKPEGDFTVELNATEKKFCIDTFDGKISASILSIPFMKLKDPIVLKERKYSVDFTEINDKSKYFNF
jgi:hypothetical protein